VTVYNIASSIYESKLNPLLKDISKGLLSILWNLRGQSVKKISGQCQDCSSFFLKGINISKKKRKRELSSPTFFSGYKHGITDRHVLPLCSTIFQHIQRSWQSLTARNLSSTLHYIKLGDLSWTDLELILFMLR